MRKSVGNTSKNVDEKMLVTLPKMFTRKKMLATLPKNCWKTYEKCLREKNAGITSEKY
jgi:hypothetical protein